MPVDLIAVGGKTWVCIENKWELRNNGKGMKKGRWKMGNSFNQMTQIVLRLRSPKNWSIRVSYPQLSSLTILSNISSPSHESLLSSFFSVAVINSLR